MGSSQSRAARARESHRRNARVADAQRGEARSRTGASRSPLIQHMAALKQRAAMVMTLYEVLGPNSALLADPLPYPLVNIISQYARELPWKLATGPPGIFGGIERLSDCSARNIGRLVDRGGNIRADTPLVAGRHAWRVRLAWDWGDCALAYIGIIEEGQGHGKCPDNDSTFFGLAMEALASQHWRVTGGQMMDEKEALTLLANGGAMDWLLDVEKGELTVVVGTELPPVDQRMVRWTGLPRQKWVPLFVLVSPQTSFWVDVLDPDMVEMETAAIRAAGGRFFVQDVRPIIYDPWRHRSRWN